MRFIWITLCALACVLCAAAGEVITAYPADLIGAEEAARYGDVLPAGEQIVWVVRYPKTEADAPPPGLLVYVSPTASGDVPRGWSKMLDAHNLIWISAVDSGNDVIGARRMLHAVLSMGAVSKDTALNPSRVYVSGFSGGGKIASTLAASFADTFKGSIHICGAVFEDTSDPARRASINANGHVLLTGRQDFNRRETKQVQRDLERAGATRVLLMDLPRLGHELPDAGAMSKAIAFLDTPAPIP